MDNLTKDELIEEAKGKITIQDYSTKKNIDGVQIQEIRQFTGEDGAFEELLRLDEQGKVALFHSFKLRQVNRSVLLPGAVKAWHLHYKQDDLWYVPGQCHLLLGLWDLRKASSTRDLKMRIVMGGGIAKMVLIPKGVAHGVANIGHKKGTLIYFINKQFDINDPDEYRLPWDKLDADFWKPEKG